MFGVIEKNDAKAIEACMINAKDSATEVYQAYVLMQTDMSAGLIAMIKAVKDVKNITSQCSNMSSDVAELEAWIENILDQPNIEDFIRQGVTSNLVKLTRQLAIAKTNWSNEKYFSFGETLGTMLFIVTTP